jgi:hypothetical protein
VAAFGGSRPVVEPVLDRKPCHARKRVDVRTHDGQIQRQGLRGDQQVVGSDRPPEPIEVRSQLRVATVGRLVERQNVEGREMVSIRRVNRSDRRRAAPYRSSAATTMLVHTCRSPTSAMRCAADLCGNLAT